MHSPIDLAERGVTLIDAELRHRENPRTFEIPPEEERRNLSVGVHVKICFLPTRSSAMPVRGERLWVEVLAVQEDPKRYVGAIANDPVLVDLKDKEVVAFEPKHVLMIYMGDDAQWH